MQEVTNWQKVKELISTNRAPLEQDTSLRFGKGLTNGEWSPVHCPLHPDSDASASLSRSGGLKCHVCCPGLKNGFDVFQWTAKLWGCSEVDALERIGQLYHYDTALRKMPPRPMKKKRQRVADEDFVRECCAELVHSTDPRARWYRDFLHRRKLPVEEVAKLDVGYNPDTGLLTFFQRRGNGELLPYWRTFDLVGGKKEWRWGGTRASMHGLMRGLWPLTRVDDIKPGQRVWIVEGEWDALTARVRLRWQDAKEPIHVLSVTHGRQGLRLGPGQMPEVLPDCDVTLAFDNDVWQHPDPAQVKAPLADELVKLRATQQGFLRDALAFYELTGAKRPLRIAAVPLDPMTAWKGDLRDWVDQGGCDPDEWPSWDFEEVRPDVLHPEPVRFDELLDHINDFVVVEGSVDAIITDSAVAPNLMELRCDAGSKPYCQNCDALQRYGPENWMIRFDGPTKRKYAIREGRDLERFIKDDLLGKPSNCPRFELVEVDYEACVRWAFGPRLEVRRHKPNLDGVTLAPRERSLVVVSHESPPMSGNVRITGHVMRAALNRSGAEQICLYAEKVEPVMRTEVDLGVYHHDLLRVRGYSDTVDEVDQAVHDMATDLAANVTHIYGQEEMHIATMLTFASVLHLPDPDGGKELLRGWLDVICFGDTGAGKTPIAERIGTAMGAGYHSSPGNTSRAGFVIASMQDQQLGVFVTKPGTLLKQHSAGLIVDESQLLGVDVFDACQSARTNGVVKSGKAGGGDRVYDAAVRLLWLANWIKGQRDNFRFACEHVAALCGGKDESVRRFDFAIAVSGKSEWERVESPSLLTPELLRVLAARAWSLRADQIDIEEGCWELALRLVRAQAHRFWQQEVPLLIAAEKDKSVMRIAAAVAALTYSHPEGKPGRLLVKQVHVEWAWRWLLRTFRSIEYDAFSASRIRAERVLCPYLAELHLCYGITQNLSMGVIRALLDSFPGTFTTADVETMFATRDAAAAWIAKAKALNIVGRTNRATTNRMTSAMRLTMDAQEIRRGWLALYDERGDIAVQHRRSVLREWLSRSPQRLPGEGRMPDLPPLVNASFEEVIEVAPATTSAMLEEPNMFDAATNAATDVYPHREEDIGRAEPMF